MGRAGIAAHGGIGGRVCADWPPVSFRMGAWFGRCFFVTLRKPLAQPSLAA